MVRLGSHRYSFRCGLVGLTIGTVCFGLEDFFGEEFILSMDVEVRTVAIFWDVMYLVWCTPV